MKKLLCLLAFACVVGTSAQNKRLPQLGKDPVENILRAMTL